MLRLTRKMVATLLTGLGMCHPAGAQQQIDRLFADYGGNGPGAAVLVVRDGKKVFTGTYGLADLEKSEPVRSNTNFRLASLTKQFTAMSVLILVDRGRLSLDDTLGAFFPEMPDFARPITITQLLQHTSGLLDYEDFVPADSPTQVHDRVVVKITARTDSLCFEPGTAFRYSNTDYSLLAMIVEQRGGVSFAAFLKQNIFDPLGMDNTVAYEKGISTVPHRAIGYSVTRDGVRNTDQSPWSAVLGDGGIYSSLDDLYKWDQALYTERLIPSELFRLALTPRLQHYGFGWRIDEYLGHKRYHHSGSTSGFRNFIQRFPDDRLTVIVLTNRADPAVETLAERVADLYL